MARPSAALARAGLALAALLALGCGPAAALGNRITVFAASSLTQPLGGVIEAYGARSPDTVRGIYGASGMLAQQIVNAAPVDIYVAADPAWMAFLRDRGLVVAATIRPLAGNRLVLLGGAGVALPHDLRRALTEVQPRRIGIADPETTGSGRYAMQALRSLKLDAVLKTDLLVALNDPAAVGMVERGELPVAFAYATDVARLPGGHVVATVPDGLHEPIVYSAALVAGGQAAARGFLDFLTGPEGQRILADAGFLPPPAVAPPSAAAPAPHQP